MFLYTDGVNSPSSCPHNNPQVDPIENNVWDQGWVQFTMNEIKFRRYTAQATGHKGHLVSAHGDSNMPFVFTDNGEAGFGNN